MPPALHVQIIQMRWTKLSRGGEAAGVRNRVPPALPVEAQELRRGVLSDQLLRNRAPAALALKPKDGEITNETARRSDVSGGFARAMEKSRGS